MNIRSLFILLLFTSIPLVAEETQTEPAPEPIRVLFVGNSYTYYWNLPQTVTKMAEFLGHRIYTEQSTVGGSNLEQHWKQEVGTQTLALIQKGGWDYVVFNNHSMSTIETSASFFEYGKKFVELVESQGGKTVFYMTWAREFNKLMLPTISGSYRQLAKDTGAYVVPVGELWMQSLSLHPEYRLHADDGSHPSPQGTYLTALAFTKFFTGESVQAVPNALQTKDEFGQNLYLNHMQYNEGNYFRMLVDSFQLTTLSKD